jgi:hypothetical protein
LGHDYKPKAIGVVGSDVYDKLLLLQLLREQLGDIILFTIDLDCRMMHHKQFKWTHNVLVASNFGLELSDQYQYDIYQGKQRNLPPFRDNYQTALFFACRTALGLRANTAHNKKPFREMETEELTQVLSHPRLFEIGRDCPVDLSENNADIHPQRAAFPLRRFLFLYLPATVVIILLLYQVSQRVRRIAAGAAPRPKTWNMSGIGMKLSVVAAIIFVALVIIDHYRPTGEPFSLGAGVSAWPGTALRLLTVILSLYFLAKSAEDLRDNEKKLSGTFALKPRSDHKAIPRRIKTHIWSVKEDEQVDSQELWREYIIDGTPRNRRIRIILRTLSFWVLLFFLIVLVGRPNMTGRGLVIWCVDTILVILCTTFMLLLLFFVLDVTRVSLELIYPLIDHDTIWPTSTIPDFEANPEMDAADFAGLIDVRFIAQLTETVGKLIYYPFIILLVAIAARNRYFDNWNLSLSLIIVYAVPSIFMVCCAIGLQHCARRARQTALNNLRRKLFTARFGKTQNRSRAIKIKYMIEEIRSLRQGAFRPFMENPVVRAILIPSGGAGLLTLLRFLLPS